MLQKKNATLNMRILECIFFLKRNISSFLRLVFVNMNIHIIKGKEIFK